MRRIAMLLSALTLAAGIAVFAPTTASADVSVCAGQGTATTGTGLYYPVFAKKTTTFAFSFTAGGCAAKATFSATGTVNGWCGRSSGKGTTTGNTPSHEFFFTSGGSVLVLTGELTGVVNAVPNTPGGESCLSPGTGADSFIITGAAVKCHAGTGGTVVNDKDTKVARPCFEPTPK